MTFCAETSQGPRLWNSRALHYRLFVLIISKYLSHLWTQGHVKAAMEAGDSIKLCRGVLAPCP